jgi:hypothetical protein
MQPQLVSDVIENSRFMAAAEGGDAGEQPLSQRATLAVALAPVLVLLALTLVIGDLIEPYLGLCGVLLSVAWLVLEMHQVQRAIGRQESEADW